MNSHLLECLYCGCENLDEVVFYRYLNRITSDCKLWPPGGRFGVCQSCGYPQTYATEIWHAEIEKIYADYTVYYQSGGQEQSVYDPVSGEPVLRSDYLVHKLKQTGAIAAEGRLLDVGCGNGNFLRAFAKAFPEWKLNGVEWDEKHNEILQGIPSFEGFYSRGVDDIPGDFDMISLIHCFEHIPDPTSLLSSLRKKLKPEGHLFIEVPDCRVNPFMLLVADHCSHFSVESLNLLLLHEGFDPICATGDWLPKEVSLLARKAEQKPEALHLDYSYGKQLEQEIAWLSKVSAHSNDLSRHGSIGLFGTSVGSTWLWAELKGRVKFFVDEDPNRIGLHHCGLPIFSPQDAPKNTPIFLALPPLVARQVRMRLQSVLPTLVSPSDFAEISQ